MQRPTVWPALSALTILAAFVAAAISSGQDAATQDADSEFQQLDERYRQILSRNPKPGPSFDRWYRLHLDAGRLKQFVVDCQTRVETNPDSSADQIVLALVCARTGEVDRALRAAEAAARLDPENYVPALLQGELLQRLGRNDDAGAAYDAALERSPPVTETISIARRLTRHYFVAGDSEKALTVWSNVERRFPDNVGILTEVAHQLAEHREFEEAIRRWEQIRRLSSRDLDLRLTAGIEIAVLEAERGDTDEAAKQFSRLLDQIKPDSWIARHLHQKIEAVFTEDGASEKLVEFYRGRLKDHADDVDTRLQFASALERTRDFDAADEEYRRAISLAPGRRDVRQTFVDSLQSRELYDSAAGQARGLTELDPLDVDAWALYGRLVLQRDRSAEDKAAVEREVAAIWDHIPAIRPNDARLALQAAELCRSSAPRAKALSEKNDAPPEPLDFSESPLLTAADGHFQEAVRRGAGDPLFRRTYGEFLHDCGHRDAALNVWLEIVVGPGDMADNWITLAETLQQYRYLDRAIEAARAAAARDPQNLKPAQLLVELLLQAKQYGAALKQLDVVRELTDDPAVLAEARERWVEAVVASNLIRLEFSRLRKLKADGAAGVEDLWRLGLLYDHVRNRQMAVKTLEAAVAVAPDDLELRRDFAVVLQHGRQFDRAVEQYREVIERSARPSVGDYERIIELEVPRNHFDEAREAARAILRFTRSNPESHRRLAAIEFLAGRNNEGLSALRDAVRLAPEDRTLRLELAHRLAKFKEYDEALEHCWRCFELTDDPTVRQSLMKSLIAAAAGSRRIEETLERLRAVRDQEKQPRDFTLCLVSALQYAGQRGAARGELARLAAERPDDVDILVQLSFLAEMDKDWHAAARWQERVVAFDKTAPQLLALISYYRRFGDDDRAERTWRQFVRSLSPGSRDFGIDIARQIVDSAIVQGNFSEAQQALEWSLSKLPDSALLRFRLGVAYLGQSDEEEAIEAFEAALRSLASRPASPPPIPAGGGTPAEFMELKTSRNALHYLFPAGNVFTRSRQRTIAVAQSIAESMSDLKTWSLVGSYAAALNSSSGDDWIAERVNQAERNPVRLREAVLAIAAEDELEGHATALSAMAERLPNDPLPHLAYALSGCALNTYSLNGRVLNGNRWQSRVFKTDETREAMRRGLLRADAWLGRHRPDLRPHIILNMARQFVLVGDRASALSAYVESLGHRDAATRKVAAEELPGLNLMVDDSLEALIEPSGVVPALVAVLKEGDSTRSVAAAVALGGLGPHSRSAISPLIETFSDSNEQVRNWAANALARIGPESVDPLVKALTDSRREVKFAAAGALRQLGSAAAPAVPGLTQLLSANDSDLACSAMLALSAIGPKAKAAVPQLVAQLQSGDPTNLRYATECLGDIGPGAQEAVPALEMLLEHEKPFVRNLARRALRHIAPETLRDAGVINTGDATEVALQGVAELDVRPHDWPQWGGWSGRNNTPDGVNIPEVWDVKSGRNIKWKAKLGSQTHGPPSVANGKLYVSTNNTGGYVKRFPPGIDLGVLLCFDENTGQFLWQLSRPKLATGRVHDWPMQGINSTPLIDGDRLWLVTNRGEVLCLDTEGFRDGENDGPFKSEANENLDEADIVWSLDMMGQLGVSQHNMANCSMTCAGELLFVCTSNGLDESHLNLPAPNAPSFMAINRWNGTVLWTDNSPGQNILHGQWCSPTYAVLDGIPQVIFGGGDGWIYSFVPEGDGKGNSKLLWKFDCNPKESRWILGGQGTRNHIIAFPVIYDGLVYLTVGQSPEHGEGAGHLWCIDPAGRGDVSPTLAVDAAGNPLPHRRIQAVDPKRGERAIPNPNSAVVWHFDKVDADGDGGFDFEEEMHRTTATPVIKDGLVYVADFGGILHCLDARFATQDLKPRVYWSHDLLSPVWDAPLVVDGKVYVADEDGDVFVFHHGREKKLLQEHYLEDAIHSAPIVANNVLYITTRNTLFAIEQAKPGP